MKSRRREREHYIRKFSQPLERRLRDSGYKFEISGRPKHIYSIYNKMIKRNKPLEEVYDLFAVRIILDTEDANDCFGVYGIVSDIYIPNPERFKNYISVPKKNGYQSIHTTVVGPDGRMVEVQIRTRSMHEVAEKGVAAHWMYKDNVANVDPELANWVSWVREIFETAAEGQVPTQQLMESFKLNLYQDEIYLFTPKGDLKILPSGSTPIDFGYEIHSKVGDHTLAAKVNGRIVPLDTKLKSGDQVEILTSKNQSPNPDWEKFVVTHKAKSHIRRWIKEEQRKVIDEGREIWEKRVKKAKLNISEDELVRFVRDKKIDGTMELFLGVRDGTVDPDELIAQYQEEQKHPSPSGQEESRIDGLFNRFISTARGVSTSIVLDGSKDNFMHNYAKCCQPLPGDDVVGFVTTGEGIKIHRRSCHNLQSMRVTAPDRIVEVHLPAENGTLFVAGVRVSGDDRPGMLNDLTHAISTYQNTNIRSVTIDSDDGHFDGTFIVNVENTDHLSRVVEKIRRVQGIRRAERFEE